MTIAIAVLATFTGCVVVWAIWLRRATWTFRHEAGPTATVALLGAGLVLSSPYLTPVFGALTYKYVRVYHLDDFLGHCCFLAAVAAILHQVLCRIVADEYRWIALWRYTRPVVLLAVPAMFVLLLIGAANDPTPSMLGMAVESTTVRLYLIVYLCALIYLSALLIRGLLVVRRDPRSRRVAHVWLTWTGMVIAACAVTLLHVHAAHTVDLSKIAWALTCAAVSMAALTYSLTWQARLRPFRKLMRGVAGTTTLPARPRRMLNDGTTGGGGVAA